MEHSDLERHSASILTWEFIEGIDLAHISQPEELGKAQAILRELTINTMLDEGLYPNPKDMETISKSVDRLKIFTNLRQLSEFYLLKTTGKPPPNLEVIELVGLIKVFSPTSSLYIPGLRDQDGNHLPCVYLARGNHKQQTKHLVHELQHAADNILGLAQKSTQKPQTTFLHIAGFWGTLLAVPCTLSSSIYAVYKLSQNSEESIELGFPLLSLLTLLLTTTAVLHSLKQHEENPFEARAESAVKKIK